MVIFDPRKVLAVKDKSWWLQGLKDYRLGVQSILNRYEAAQSLSEKISIMQEMERLSYDEMQNFLRTHDKARFVM